VVVIAGLASANHRLNEAFFPMDPRVKPAGDAAEAVRGPLFLFPHGAHLACRIETR
jgi:hypothetical protein